MSGSRFLALSCGSVRSSESLKFEIQADIFVFSDTRVDDHNMESNGGTALCFAR
jgi:hypothetical protein